MGEYSPIEWCDHTASFFEGCSKVSAGCARCYAESFEKRVGNDIWGKLKPRKWTKGGPALIRKLNSKAAKAGRVDTVFVNDLADFFEEFNGPVVDHKGEQMFQAANGSITPCTDWTHPLSLNDLRRDAFRLFDECKNLIFMLLTKRPENIRRMWPYLPMSNPCISTPGKYRDNVWIGTSVENQEAAHARITELLKCRDLSPVLFLSCEPLLGPLDLWNSPAAEHGRDCTDEGYSRMLVDWVIVGGESGHGARPCKIEWIRSIRDQCQAADVPVFIKQVGSNPWLDPGELEQLRSQPGYVPLKDRKGGNVLEWPIDLRVRQMPNIQKVAT